MGFWKIVSASFYGVKVGSGINTDSVLSIHSSYTLGYGKDSIGYGAGTNPLAYPIDLLNSQQVDKTDLPTSFDWIKYDFYPGYGNQYYTMTANVPYVISLNYSVGNDFEITEDDYLAAGFTGTVYDGDLHDGNLSYLFKNIVYSVDAWFTGSSADVMIKLSGDLTEISLNKPVTFYSRTDSLPAIFYSEP
ncbi:hypothetical protein KKH13_05215 [Patescibacteria group bacterium]|nr:hypothetical protein [Patescibacteria group bacterium]